MRALYAMLDPCAAVLHKLLQASARAHACDVPAHPARTFSGTRTQDNSGSEARGLVIGRRDSGEVVAVLDGGVDVRPWTRRRLQRLQVRAVVRRAPRVLASNAHGGPARLRSALQVSAAPDTTRKSGSLASSLRAARRSAAAHRQPDNSLTTCGTIVMVPELCVSWLAWPLPACGLAQALGPSEPPSPPSPACSCDRLLMPA